VNDEEELHISWKWLVVIFVASCLVEVAVFNVWQGNEAQSEVYDYDKNAVLVSEEVRVGEARLKAEIGFMSMDLQELSYYFQHNVTGQQDLYQYQGFKLPSLFVAEKGGECEDYVMFALAVLDHERYELKPIIGTWCGEGHAYLLLDDGKDIWMVDTFGIRTIDSKAFTDYSFLPEEYAVGTVLTDMLHDNSIGGLLRL
jgi:hypothetical protein